MLWLVPFMAIGQKPEIVQERAGCQFGLKDSLGQWLFTPQFDYIEPFSDYPQHINFRYARVEIGDLSGLIGRKGQVILPVAYKNIRMDFSIDSSVYAIPGNRQILVRNEHAYANNKLRYYFGRRRELNFPLLHEDAEIDYRLDQSHFVLERQNGHYALFNIKTRKFEVWDLAVDHLEPPIDGVRVAIAQGKSGLIKDSSMVLPCEYDEVIPLLNKVVAIRKDFQWGLAQVDGQILATPQYDSLQPQWHNGLLAAKKEGQVVLIDHKGQEKYSFPGGRLPMKMKPESRIGRDPWAYNLFSDRCFAVRASKTKAWLINTENELLFDGQPVSSLEANIEKKVLFSAAISQTDTPQLSWKIIHFSGNIVQGKGFSEIQILEPEIKTYNTERHIACAYRNDSIFLFNETLELIYTGKRPSVSEFYTVADQLNTYLVFYDGEKTRYFLKNRNDELVLEHQGHGTVHVKNERCGKGSSVIVVHHDGLYGLINWQGQTILPLEYKEYDNNQYHRFDEHCRENSYLTGEKIFSFHEYFTANIPFKPIKGQDFGIYESPRQTIFYDEDGAILLLVNCRIRDKKWVDSLESDMYFFNECGAYVAREKRYLPDYIEVKRFNNFHVYYRTDGKPFKGKYKYLSPLGTLGFVGSNERQPSTILDRDTNVLLTTGADVHYNRLSDSIVFYKSREKTRKGQAYYKRVKLNGKSLVAIDTQRYTRPFRIEGNLGVFQAAHRYFGLMDSNYRVVQPARYSNIYAQKNVAFFAFNSVSTTIYNTVGQVLFKDTVAIPSLFRNGNCILRKGNQMFALSTEGELRPFDSLSFKQLMLLARSFIDSTYQLPNTDWSKRQKRQFIEFMLLRSVDNHQSISSGGYYLQQGDTVGQTIAPLHACYAPVTRNRTSPPVSDPNEPWRHTAHWWAGSHSNDALTKVEIRGTSPLTFSVDIFLHKRYGSTYNIRYTSTYLVENERYELLSLSEVLVCNAKDSAFVNNYIYNHLALMEIANITCSPDQNYLQQANHTFYLSKDHLTLVLWRISKEPIEVSIPKNEIEHLLSPPFR